MEDIPKNDKMQSAQAVECTVFRKVHEITVGRDHTIILNSVVLVKKDHSILNQNDTTSLKGDSVTSFVMLNNLFKLSELQFPCLSD